MGGIGKTTLAKYFIDKYHHEYTSVLWVNAANGIEKGFINNELIDSLSLLSQIQYYTSPGDKFDKIIDTLRKIEPAYSLLIIDNADKKIKSEVSKKIQLKPNWKVILTSRTRLAGFELFPIKPLSENLCIDLFFKNYSKQSRTSNHEKTVRKIINAVYRHTLTIELLAKTTQYNPSYTIEGLWETIASKGISDDLNIDVEIDYNRLKEAKTTISKCLNIAFSLSEFGADNFTKQILSYLSILPPIQIEFQIAKSLFKIGPDEEMKFINSINALYEKGWIEIETNGAFTYIYMHPIIQDTVRKKIKPSVRNLSDFISELSKNITFSTYQPQQNNQNVILYTPFIESIIEKFDKDQDLSIASLCFAYSQVLRNYYGDHQKSIDYSLKALKIRFEKLPQDDHEVLASINNCAIGFRSLNQPDKAFQLINQALKILQDKSEKSEETLISIANYNNTQGQILKSLGKPKEALNSFKSGLDIIINNKLIHPHLEASLNDNIGNTYTYALNEPQIAITFMEYAVSLAEKHQDPLIYNYYNNIAGCYLDLNDLEKAEFYIEKVIQNYESMPHKETNSNLAIAYNQYSDILLDRYHYNGNEEDIKQALETRNKSILIKQRNQSLRSLAISYNGMAKILNSKSSIQDATKALEYSLAAIEAFKKINDIINLKNAYQVIIAVYTQLEMHAEAQAYSKLINQ